MEQISDKISVITVVYNDVEHIRETLDSCLSQTWEDIEYIVIDGGSTDGTADIIREYAGRLSYWCSEPDGGIYDAMNKGIKASTGEWINFLNSGDCYVTADALKEMMTFARDHEADVLFGNSIELHDAFQKRVIAPEDTRLLEYGPTFRHGSAIIRAAVHKQHLFDLSLSKSLGYALDWEMLYRLFKEGYHFVRVDVMVQAYRKEGVSNHPYKNLWYNYKITSQGRFNLKKYFLFLKHCMSELLRGSCLFKWARAFVLEFMVNDVLHYIPFWTVRKFYLRCVGTKIGKGSFIMKSNYVMDANHLVLGKNSHVNRDCILDARGGITIGDNVSVSHRVNIMTGGHDIYSPSFIGLFQPVVIEDYVWLGVGCTILQGVRVGRGAVVSAGAVVTKDVEPFTVVGGVPAKVIGERRVQVDYQCRGWQPFT